MFFFFFFFNDTATTEIYTLSLHDALPISVLGHVRPLGRAVEDLDQRRDGPEEDARYARRDRVRGRPHLCRSEEHTSELQSLAYLVCRLLLEKKKNNI